MIDKNPALKTSKPKNLLVKPLEFDFRELFKALTNGIIHIASTKWDEIGTDFVETVSAIGLKTEPQELAYTLIHRSVSKALFDLVGQSVGNQLPETIDDSRKLVERLSATIVVEGIYLNGRFFDRPGDLPLVRELQSVLEIWLVGLGVAKASADAMSNRLPAYFTYALSSEWRKHLKRYKVLFEALDTPFSQAEEREWAWYQYAALLKLRIHEGIFDEPFGLSQIYVPLNAFYLEEGTSTESSEETMYGQRRKKKVIVQLHSELEEWLSNTNQQDAIRVLSGGPGSGKSEFARIFAAEVAEKANPKVLYVPLHLIDPAGDLTSEIERFVKEEGILTQNPLDPESSESCLLLLFDGLDELASQGKAANEMARDFIQNVEHTVELRNHSCIRLRVLFSGRELVVQENETAFRRPKQILTLLPYTVLKSNHRERHRSTVDEGYDDPHELLKADLRQQWWEKYGTATGLPYKAMPKELDREDLEEITAQPLLNYLLALSFARGKLNFTQGVNLNDIYKDLVDAVYARAWDRKRPYQPIRHMELKDFFRILEEIGLAAWHGDGRTTTVREIEDHCRVSGLDRILKEFEDSAKSGVTRLLAAFFFRQYGHHATGDPTFEFTHKSFGEYLAARRVVLAIETAIRDLVRREENPDDGKDYRMVLEDWVRICGPSPISRYLHSFLLNEVRLRDKSILEQWQIQFTKLFNYMLRNGSPMQQIPGLSFKEALYQSRNAEESLLAALNAFARVTQQVSSIDHEFDPAAFGAWFRRIQGQRIGGESVLAAKCLSYLDLQGAILYTIDFFSADLRYSNLQNSRASYANLGNAYLDGVNLIDAFLPNSNLMGADLDGANLESAILTGASFKDANLKCARLVDANLADANLMGANLVDANLEKANFKGANFERANLVGANLKGTDRARAKFAGAIIR